MLFPIFFLQTVVIRHFIYMCLCVLHMDNLLIHMLEEFLIAYRSGSVIA